MVTRRGTQTVAKKPPGPPAAQGAAKGKMMKRQRSVSRQPSVGSLPPPAVLARNHSKDDINVGNTRRLAAPAAPHFAGLPRLSEGLPHAAPGSLGSIFEHGEVAKLDSRDDVLQMRWTNAVNAISQSIRGKGDTAAAPAGDENLSAGGPAPAPAQQQQQQPARLKSARSLSRQQAFDPTTMFADWHIS